MNPQLLPDYLSEPERYELHAAPFYHFDLDRREFFKVLGCGVVVLCFVEAAVAQESGIISHYRNHIDGTDGHRKVGLCISVQIANDNARRTLRGSEINFGAEAYDAWNAAVFK